MPTKKKKLYNGKVIEVDLQIYRWRERLKKENFKLPTKRGLNAQKCPTIEKQPDLVPSPSKDLWKLFK